MGKHIPLRTCVLCGRQGEKRGLLRVVRTPAGEMRTDESGKARGRGAYVCREGTCRQALDRALALGDVGPPAQAQDAASRATRAAWRKLAHALRLSEPTLPGHSGGSRNPGTPGAPQL